MSTCLVTYTDHMSTCLASSLDEQLRDQGQVLVAGQMVQADEVYIARKFVGSKDMLEAVAVEDMGGALLLMDIQVDEEALMLSAARDLINRVQKLKKKAGVSPSDSLVLAYQVMLLPARLGVEGRVPMAVALLCLLKQSKPIASLVDVTGVLVAWGFCSFSPSAHHLFVYPVGTVVNLTRRVTGGGRIRRRHASGEGAD